MAIYLSAGHHLRDAGATRTYKGKTYKESDITRIYRDKTLEYIKEYRPDARVITDNDNETLSQYLRRIKPGNASVVIEYHVNAGPLNKPGANGAEGIVEQEADRLDFAFANELMTNFKVAGMPLRKRSVIREDQTYRGRLGLMREEGIICLVEIGFITNDNDLELMMDDCFIDKVCALNAKTILKFEDMI